MGDVHSRRSPPFPSPTETLPPIAVSQPHHLQTPQSPGYRVPNNDIVDRLPKEAIIDGRHASTTSTLGKPRFSRGDSADQTVGLTPLPEESKPTREQQEEQGRSSQTLKELRRQMEELLSYQQMQQSQHQTSSLPAMASSNLLETPRKRRLSHTSAADPSSTITGLSSGSVGSTGTVKGIDSAATPERPANATPSYPFPRVQTETKPSQSNMEQTGRQGQFRLKFPSAKLKSPSEQTTDSTAHIAEVQNAQPTFLPSDHMEMPEDPAFPSPNLYDLTLKLNADAGLDAWWSNLVDILQMHYGAERASLAVPGDSTDLENVPWGQKAIFDQNPIGVVGTSSLSDGSPSMETNDGANPKPEGLSTNQFNVTPAALSNRPPLSSRHSFAEFGGKKQLATDQPRQYSSKTPTGRPEKKHARIAGNPPTVLDPPPPVTSSTHSATRQEHRESPSCSGSLQQGVFPIPKPLEVESDPLIKRTGVVRLFGRSTPIVLTRKYSKDTINLSHHPAQSPLEMVQKTPNAEDGDGVNLTVPTDPAPNSHSAPVLRKYDEYEQIPQSPWSQSPAPSPAPKMQTDQNPFFNNHAVDEGAFEKNPPPHDYSNTNPLEAIGIDHSKTVIHIPLLHRGRFNENSPSTLRFPVAIISLVSNIVPYPPGLRRSLAHLMPHLTTSFLLAQQYSQLERQVTSKVETPRFGHLLGLGGTFSDESSELELVAGLSGHVSYAVGDEPSMSARASITSPSDRSSAKFSPAMSSLGTPGLELGHMGISSAAQSPAINARLGDAADSYFNVQHAKRPRDNVPQQWHHRSKSKGNATSSTPVSPGKMHSKSLTGEENNLQDPTLVTSPLQDMKPPVIVSPTQQSSRQASTNSFYAQLQRELPRPFSDSIAQLMLNSVPLHIFLAKPQSGEVIWTNAKFDAYRRSKPHEQKLRDPWQNIHISERDHVSSEWANALRTGSQFTERVRVKRFNDESAYRWFIFRANPLLSSTGEVLYWIGSFLDIHEQHIAELKATQEREKFATDAKYRAFSNSIPQVVFEATENRGLIFVNEQWNLYTGQKLDEALNLGFAKHVHPEDLDKCGGISLQRTPELNDTAGAVGGRGRSSSESHSVASTLEELVKRGVATLQKDENGRVFYCTEIRLSSRGGDFRWHLVRLVRVETSSFGSEEASWYGTCTDINDRKNLERELNKAMTQLNSQMESKTKFFSNMSHEIRTPLNGILGTIPFILDTQLDSDQRRMLDTIQNSSTNLRELVDNILDVSRVEAGKMSMVNSWFHVRSMIEDVIDTIASRAIDKGLEINYLMESDVPSMVVGDRFRIRQVLINLVGNAVKFTAQGEIHIACNLHHDANHKKTTATEAFLNFDVVDTGKGFSSQDAERLMQRFSQLGETGSQQHAGSGLGLFLSKQLVEMHGGKLTPSSREGQGAKFSFNVKVDAPPPPSPSERPGLLRQASKVSRRPGASRTTSYDQSNTLSPSQTRDIKPQDPTLLSPALESPDSATRMESRGVFPPSALSSSLPTPDINTANLSSAFDQVGGSGKGSSERASPHRHPSVSQRSISPGTPGIEPVASSPLDSLFIVILCPFDNARKATKQHIEQVVPHETSFKITALPDLDEWKDKMQPASSTQCTHLVINLPATDDILEVIQHVSEFDSNKAPVVVIISDLYQKRQISTRVKELAASGKKVFIVPKPVKPSAFSLIFDPHSERELSKDRNQDMAREINNNFKTVSKMVKEVLGNKGYRILLVEDDETNRDVMLKYLEKIKLMSETASNGQECTDMVLSKEPGYYSLIICDIQMPVKNGYDTCRDIRAWEQKNHYPQIPIMALSANAMTDQIENAAQAGFNDYVTKPIKHNELGKMMMGLLDPARPLLLLRDRLHPDNDRASTRR